MQNQAIAEHRRHVIRAMLSGETIREPVLADYEDLQLFQEFRNLLASEAADDRPDTSAIDRQDEAPPVVRSVPLDLCPFCRKQSLVPEEDGGFTCSNGDCRLEGITMHAGPRATVAMDQRGDQPAEIDRGIASPTVDAVISRGLPAGIAISQELRQRVLAAVKKKRETLGLETE